MYSKVRTEFFRPVLWHERKACQTVLIILLPSYALLPEKRFLWKQNWSRVKNSTNKQNRYKLVNHLLFKVQKACD